MILSSSGCIILGPVFRNILFAKSADVEDNQIKGKSKMSIATITIPLDTDTARVYTEAPAEVQKKLRILLSLWLREFAVSPRSLRAVMDEISENAQARGLSPEMLESLLHAD